MNANQIIEKIKAHPDGVTLNFEDGTVFKPSQGVAVSITDNPITWKQLNPSFIKRLRHASRLLNNAYVGSWYDRERKRVCVDITLIYPTLKEALPVARKHRQKAVYDFETGQVINL